MRTGSNTIQDAKRMKETGIFTPVQINTSRKKRIACMILDRMKNTPAILHALNRSVIENCQLLFHLLSPRKQGYHWPCNILEYTEQVELPKELHASVLHGRVDAYATVAIPRVRFSALHDNCTHQKNIRRSPKPWHHRVKHMIAQCCCNNRGHELENACPCSLNFPKTNKKRDMVANHIQKTY